MQDAFEVPLGGVGHAAFDASHNGGKSAAACSQIVFEAATQTVVVCPALAARHDENAFFVWSAGGRSDAQVARARAMALLAGVARQERACQAVGRRQDEFEALSDTQSIGSGNSLSGVAARSPADWATRGGVFANGGRVLRPIQTQLAELVQPNALAHGGPLGCKGGAEGQAAPRG